MWVGGYCCLVVSMPQTHTHTAALLRGASKGGRRLGVKGRGGMSVNERGQQTAQLKEEEGKKRSSRPGLMERKEEKRESRVSKGPGGNKDRKEMDAVLSRQARQDRIFFPDRICHCPGPPVEPSPVSPVPPASIAYQRSQAVLLQVLRRRGNGSNHQQMDGRMRWKGCCMPTQSVQ